MEVVDTTAKDAMAAAATDTTAVGMMAADSPGVAVTTTTWRRGVAAAEDSACRARHRDAVCNSQAG